MSSSEELEASLVIEKKNEYSKLTQCAWCCAFCPVACCFGSPGACSFCVKACLLRCGIDKPIKSLPSSSGERKKVYFDGAGFASGFGLGVASHLCEKYNVSDFDVYGVSGGTLAALCLALKMNPVTDLLDTGRLEKYNEKFMSSTPCFGALGNLGALRDMVDDILPPNAHEIITNLYLVISVWPTLSLRFRGPRYQSRTDIIDAIVASCSIPGFALYPQCKHGCCYFDAAFQAILTPPDPLVDLTVRPMPVLDKLAYPKPTLVVTDQSAKTIGHQLRYPSSFIPLGASVWPGHKPPPTFTVQRDLILHAKAQAQQSALIAEALFSQISSSNNNSPSLNQQSSSNASPVVQQHMSNRE